MRTDQNGVPEPTWDECIRRAAGHLRALAQGTRSQSEIDSTQKHIDQWLALATKIRLNDESINGRYWAIKEGATDEDQKHSNIRGTLSRRFTRLDRLVERTLRRAARARTYATVASDHVRQISRHDR